MVRAFSSLPIEPDVLDRVLHALFRGPSAGFTQSLEVLVLDTPSSIERFWSLSFPDSHKRSMFRWQGLFDAPVLLIPVVLPSAYSLRYSEADKVASGLGASADRRRSIRCRSCCARRRLVQRIFGTYKVKQIAEPLDESAWTVPYWWVDGGMGVMATLLSIVDENLAGLFFGLFDREQAILEAFGVPSEYRALGALALGYPAPDEPGHSAATRPRRPYSEVIHRNQW